MVVLALAVPAALAVAQTYPARPVRLVVPYPAGGPLDEVARAFGQRLSETWGQPLVVENRGGAGGSVGADVVAKSAPDGYTLLLGNAGPITVNPNLRRDLPYNPQRDLAPVTQIVAAPMVLVVHPSLPVKSVRELTVLAKANPGKLNYASAGIGNLQHLAMESLQSMMGIFTRAGTPPEVIAKLHMDFARTGENREIRENLAKRGAQFVVGGPEAMAKIVREENALYAKVIQSAKIAAE